MIDKMLTKGAICRTLLILATVNASAAIPLPFDTDFESSEGFSPGILVSDLNWILDASLTTAEIVGAESASGN